MTEYKAYLFDLDGTIYHGGKPIPEAVTMVNHLADKGIPYVFVTNNSTTSPQQVAERLQKMGIPAEAKDVVTSSQATVHYLNEQGCGKAMYTIGQAGLFKELEAAGYQQTEEQPDVVIIGMNPEVTYKELAHATLAIAKGALFISTNPDKALPMEIGLMPGNGALTAFVATATSQEPTFIGKPFPTLMHLALDRLQLTKDEVLMVGDNYLTDISAGINSDIDTLLVLSGFTQRADLETVEKQPTYIVNSLSDWKV